jgi:hypothetical protein
MVTYPHPVASRERIRTVTDDAHAEGLRGRALDRLRQMICAVRGHDAFLQFQRNRMFLRCVSCGHESPGWALTEAPPTVTMRGDARRHMLVPPQRQLIDARRIA